MQFGARIVSRGSQSPETNAQPKTAFPLKKRIVCRPKSLPKLWTSCRRPPDPPRVPCEPVSVCNRTGLRPAEREIEKWRPETGDQPALHGPKYGKLPTRDWDPPA